MSLNKKMSLKRVVLWSLVSLLPVVQIFSAEKKNERFVTLLPIEGAIGPITSRLIVDAVKSSIEERAEALIIELNTPGGLDESMRGIVKELLNAELPVIVYVAPSGSRAASAGVFITLAAHIAAMAPGTNIGAAHPVAMGGQVDSTMMGKIENDAAAFIKSIAHKRGRNEVWAEKSVRKSESITESEALKLNVIDLIAVNVRELLDKVDGRKVQLPIGEKTLSTKELVVNRIEIGLTDRILQVISNPNIAYILFSLGMLGLFFELSNPGSILPGIVGVICLILAFFAFQSLPINYAGLLLMIFALILFIAEVKVVSHGALTIGGIISMILGSLMLIDTEVPYMKVSLFVILTMVAATALFFIFAVGMGLKAQRKKPTTGAKGMMGEIGVVDTRIDPEGLVFIAGELWKAKSELLIEKGEKVKVVKVENLTLIVTKA